jgi:ribonucleoside-diphosphate reductase beta chain
MVPVKFKEIMYSNLNLTAQSDRLFFGECGHGLARYDQPRHPIFITVNDKMKSLFWNPKEVDVANEKSSFNKMTDQEKFVFTSNLQRQILLDTIQGRSPALTFMPFITDSSLENCFGTLMFFEQIHSESYTHIIRAIYPDPSVIFDEIPTIVPIADCANSITEAYDRMVASPSKENLYLALISANALEALRFFVSFGCTFSFGERGLVEGSAKIVKMIARDEAQHLALIQHVLKRLPKDDPEFIEIIGDLRNEAIAIFDDTAEQEKAWAPYIFQHGSILGLNTSIMEEYIDYLNPRRKAAAGLAFPTKSEKSHPLPWIEKWLSDSNYQPAPQEVEGTAYLTSSLKNDVSDLVFEL